MISDMEMPEGWRRFKTTSWSLVRAARHAEALNTLLAHYWKPLYFFVRQRGYDAETAKDVVQGFVASLIERKAIARADPARGRFRTFLLSALTNFLKDWARAESRQKRGAGRIILPIDFARGDREYSVQVAAGEAPERVLKRAWARGLWDQSLSELRGVPAHLEAFHLHLNGADYRTIIQKTGLSEAAAKTAIHRLRGRLREIVLRHVRAHSDSEEDLHSELAEFLSLLR